MTHVIVGPDPGHVARRRANTVPVQLYSSSHERGGGAIGGRLWYELGAVFAPLNPVAFDLLSLSMAATAADTFVNRDNAPDGWAREIELTVQLLEPRVWGDALPFLELALRFVSGDQWTLRVIDGGEPPPPFRKRTRRPIDPRGCDCACLYSGGLDSAVGVLDLVEEGRRPILVSHAYTKDAEVQEDVLRYLGPGLVRFGAQAHPTSDSDWPHDVQMRTRSFNFLALGVLFASALQPALLDGPTTLYVPENGLIALNPPLTRRRIGALSTRTTHPHFLALIQEVLNRVGLNVQLGNPYAHATKGEMLSQCAQPEALSRLAHRTVSCGKWKRSGKQCGRCVPCLIRRASFHAAGIRDRTGYAVSARDLGAYMEYGNGADDLMAMTLAARRLDHIDFAGWVATTGPLPLDPSDKAVRIDAVRRGMMEVRQFLRAKGVM